MISYVYLVFIYEVLANLQTEFARSSMVSPIYNLSALERKLWKSETPSSLIAMLFIFVARINGIAFLIYLGFKTIWWHPILLWLGCLVCTAVAASLFKGKAGLAIPGMLSFIILPFVGVILWFSV